jgi:hypothetical protein
MRKETVERVEIKGENDCPKGNLHSLKIGKILLPLDFIDLPLHLVHQTAVLAHHFDSEIVLLHVVTPLSYPAGVFVDKHSQVARDLLDEIVTRARAKTR